MDPVKSSEEAGLASLGARPGETGRGHGGRLGGEIGGELGGGAVGTRQPTRGWTDGMLRGGDVGLA